MTDKQFLEAEINQWRRSKKRAEQITGEEYYVGLHDILRRERTVIGENGILTPVQNLPNNKIIDNQYAKMVDQKVNYLVGKPLTFDTENEKYEETLKAVFNKKFQRVLKNLGEDSLNGGIAWLHPYYNEQGEFGFKRFASYEVLPFWRDSEHTALEMAVRMYDVEAYDGHKSITVSKAEVYTSQGILRYVWQNGYLLEDSGTYFESYITANDKEYNWGKIPLVAFKYNNKELPLIRRCKSLQDGVNVMLSDFENNMQEDSRNTILILVNYDGENLGDFRQNLATYGAVKVKTVDGAAGDLRALQVEVNAENYKNILDVFKKALIENARGYDAKDDRMSGNPNQMNIQSMYSDIDLDANGMETEYQASFEDLLWFVNAHLANSGQGNFLNAEVNIIFNRDILINESESIDNCQKSVGILSSETIIGQHPWTTDVQKELERVDAEKKKAMDEYNEYDGAFNVGASRSAEGANGKNTQN